jgi:hypothetical protein
LGGLKQWRGSGLDYSDIEFTRRYHPPLKGYLFPEVNASFYPDKMKTVVYLAHWKKMGQQKNDNVAYNDMLQIFLHEAIHGVVYSILEVDGICDCEVNNHEFPHINGMDPVYTRRYKQAIKPLVCDCCKHK